MQANDFMGKLFDYKAWANRELFAAADARRVTPLGLTRLQNLACELMPLLH